MSFPCNPARPQPTNTTATGAYRPGQYYQFQQPNDGWARPPSTTQYPQQIFFLPCYAMPPVTHGVPAQPADTYVSQSSDTRPDDLYLFIAAARHHVVSFDLRNDPRTKPPAPDAQGHSRASIFRCPTKSIRLVCREFPWMIEINEDMISCKDVWEAVYDALQERLTPQEWAMADEKKRREIQQAVELRRGGPLPPTGAGYMPPRRVDWLGDMTVFAGLSKDDVLLRERVAPWFGDRDTVAIRLTRRCR